MLLHATRLVVPRGGRAAIDVHSPLPDYWGDWRSEVSGQGGAGTMSLEVPASAGAIGEVARGDEA